MDMRKKYLIFIKNGQNKVQLIPIFKSKIVKKMQKIGSNSTFLSVSSFIMHKFKVPVFFVQNFLKFGKLTWI